MTHVSGHTAYTKQVRTLYVPGTQGVKVARVVFVFVKEVAIATVVLIVMIYH